MAQQLGGYGNTLPVGQLPIPSGLGNAPFGIAGNTVALQPGQGFALPPGDWQIQPGLYSFIQVLDPTTNSWRVTSAERKSFNRVKSDGFNVRVANLLGCPVGAIVVAGGSGYAQATTTVTPSVGNSTWQAIVGGMVSVISVATAGSGYGIPPIVEIAPPPSPGVQATGYAVLTGGSVTSIALTNVGAGYVSVPQISIFPNPFDPNYVSGSVAIVNAVASIGLTGGTASSGSIAAVLCTNPGVSVASAPTLTVAGAGSSASVAAVRLTTMTDATIVGAGTGFSNGAMLVTSGGRPTDVPQWTNPATDFSKFVPRPAQAGFATVSGSLVSVSTIFDGGIFAGSPAAAVVAASGFLATTAASVTLTLGAAQDTIYIQSGP